MSTSIKYFYGRRLQEDGLSPETTDTVCNLQLWPDLCPPVWFLVCATTQWLIHRQSEPMPCSTLCGLPLPLWTRTNGLRERYFWATSSWINRDTNQHFLSFITHTGNKEKERDVSGGIMRRNQRRENVGRNWKTNKWREKSRLQKMVREIKHLVPSNSKHM